MIIWMIVPCYNEEKRLELGMFRIYLNSGSEGGTNFLFVNDGSQDGTAQMLDSFSEEVGSRVEVLHLDRNMGKAEAVRRGMLRAMDDLGADYAGYIDADLATPLYMIDEFSSVLN